MIRDAISLTRLEILRRWRQSMYWLQVLGVRADDSLAYKIYFAIFALLWVSISWAWASDLTYQNGRQLFAEDVAFALEFIRRLSIILVTFLWWSAMWQTPIRFTGPETTYLVAAPLRRSALTTLQCLKSMAIYVVPAAIIVNLASLYLNWTRFAPNEVGLIGLVTLFATVLVVASIAASMWIVALFRYRYPHLRRPLWLFPILIWPFARFAPEVILPLGWWAQIFRGEAYLIPIIGLCASAIVLLGIVALLGHRLNLARAVENSATYARIARLGFGMDNRAIIADIRMEGRLRSRIGRKRRVRLPTSQHGLFTLFQRSLVRTFTPIWAGTVAVLFIGPGYATGSMVLLNSLDSLDIITFAPLLYVLVYNRPTFLSH